MNPGFVKGKIRRRMPPYLPFSLSAEGLAVGALVLSGSCLVGAHQDPLQGAEVCILAVILALLDSTLNALVCMAIHGVFLLIFVMGLDCPTRRKTCISFMLTIDFFPICRYNRCGICEFSQICIIKAETPSLKRKEFCHDL